MPKISVVISTYNGLDKLKLTLAAYTNQSLQDFEIIVAADGSSDGTVEFIKNAIKENRYPFKLKGVWHEDKGFRLARIRNCGWKHAESPRVVFTDQDIIPNDTCLEAYSDHTEEVAIAGYIGWIDEKIHRNFHPDTIGKLKKFDPFMTKPEMRDLEKFNFWVLWGGNMSLTKNLLERTGGFDEEFIGWGGEDTDLGLRCERSKYPIATLKEAKMFHLDHKASNSLNRTGTDLFFEKKQHDTSIIRNKNANYNDVLFF